MNARLTGCIWPSGIARQDSRNCYFILVSVGTKEGSDHFVPGRDRVGWLPEDGSLAHGQFYFSISEAQFRSTEGGAAFASSTFVRIRNL
jgi:hypothetical protein